MSEEYKSSKLKLQWRCEMNHLWEAMPLAVISNNSWCEKCGQKSSALKRSSNLKKMKELAISKKGLCLSTEYKNSKEKLDWKCEIGHLWSASGGSISSGRWCPICANQTKTRRLKQKTLTIENMQNLALEKGGKCLSTTYTNNNTHLKWQCADGHIWEAKPSNIKSGTWCPECKSYVGENITRSYFEHIFSKPFPKVRARWLPLNHKAYLELDGYNEELKLAFEHHGRHHFLKSQFASTNYKLLKRKKDDLLKKRYCKKNGVTLISIPEIGRMTDPRDLYGLIIKQLNKFKFSIPNHIPIEFDRNQIIKSSSQLRKLRELARSKNWELISQSYLGSSQKHLWKCVNNHTVELTPSKLKMGRGCAICSKKKKYTIEDAQKSALIKNGKCLSKKYVNRKTKLKWQCHEGHRWETTYGPILKGHWCPKCAKIRNSEKQRGTLRKASRFLTDSVDLGNNAAMAELNLIAQKRNGKCLSKEYFSMHTKMKWQCEKGHVWEAAPNSVKYRNSWCPVCRKITMRSSK